MFRFRTMLRCPRLRVHPEDRSLVAEMDAQARNHGQAFEIEYRVTRSDGEVRILRERTDVIRDSLGKPSRLVGVVHDITEIRLSELRLKESDERYALAARGAGAGLWDWNFSSGRSYFSPRMHELLAVPQGSLDQSIGEFFKCFLPEDRKKLESQLEELYATQSERLELEVRSNVTDFRWFQIRGLVVYENSRPARLVGSLIDITDRKRAFEEIARQREALYQNEKMAMLGSLLAGVSHELNNPLSVVIGQAALLEETVSDPSVLKRVARIQNATERCARIVRTFLAMARQRDLQFAPVHINSVVDTVLELLAFQLRSSQIQVERDLAFGDPLLMGDADQLHQLLTNLVVNARQALASVTSPRFIRISTRLISQRRLQILVSDNGPGIPAEIRPRIFDPFFSTKPAGEGTGIGLSLCSSIIRAHGGSITVDNNAKGGATFTIELPRHTGDHPFVESRKEDAASKGRHVLIIEDEAEIAQMLSEIIHGRGHEAVIAVDGLDGLKSALSRDFDAILSDIRLPGASGLEIYRELQRKRPKLISRLAFITGDTLSPDIQCFLLEMKTPCLEKPFMPSEVLDLLSHLTAEIPR